MISYDAAEKDSRKMYAAQMNSRKKVDAQTQEVRSNHSPLVALATRNVM